MAGWLNKYAETTAEEPKLKSPTEAVWAPGWAGYQQNIQSPIFQVTQLLLLKAIAGATVDMHVALPHPQS